MAHDTEQYVGSREHGDEPCGFHRTRSIDFTQGEAALPHKSPKSRMTEAPMLQFSYAKFHSRYSTMHSVPNFFVFWCSYDVCPSVRPSKSPSIPSPHKPLAVLFEKSRGLGQKKKTSSHPNKNSAFRKSSFWSIARSAWDRWKVRVRGGWGS